MPTKQETFDEVVAHLRRQGCKAENDDGCAYRGDGGTKCAAGCLIPDEEYRPDLEGCSVLDPSMSKASPPGEIVDRLGHDLVLVCDLQRAHDSLSVGSWEWRFQKIAEIHGLEYHPPESVEPEAAHA